MISRDPEHSTFMGNFTMHTLVLSRHLQSTCQLWNAPLYSFRSNEV